MKEYVILPSVDGDPGDTFPNSRFSGIKGATWIRDAKNHVRQYQAAVEHLLTLFDELGFKGKTTWFLNERDTGWTRHYKGLIKTMAEGGYEIALHTHVGTVFQKKGLEGPALRPQAQEIMKRTKADLEDCAGRPCLTHRFGCYLQDSFFYGIVKRLDFKVLSDVVPGVHLRDLEGHTLNDETVPLNAPPWRHDEHNWLEHTSRRGHFLHVPVCTAGIGEDRLLDEQQSRKGTKKLKGITVINHTAQKAKEHGVKHVCWDIHPHEIQSPYGGINLEKLQELRLCLETIEAELRPTYRNLRDLL